MKKRHCFRWTSSVFENTWRQMLFRLIKMNFRVWLTRSQNIHVNAVEIVKELKLHPDARTLIAATGRPLTIIDSTIASSRASVHNEGSGNLATNTVIGARCQTTGSFRWPHWNTAANSRGNDHIYLSRGSLLVLTTCEALQRRSDHSISSQNTLKVLFVPVYGCVCLCQI